MQCVITLSFSILVNGGKTKQFHPSQGLRQGDPLSPYLFIICQEVLYRLIENKLALGNISGVRMNVSGQIITHVMFADHLMLFAKANRREVEALNDCIETYYLWSGQKVNREKSGLIFSKLVQNDTKRWIKGELQMKSLPIDSFYLGTPCILFKIQNKRL